jgi:hypothetical protein
MALSMVSGPTVGLTSTGHVCRALCLHKQIETPTFSLTDSTRLAGAPDHGHPLLALVARACASIRATSRGGSSTLCVRVDSALAGLRCLLNYWNCRVDVREDGLGPVLSIGSP